MSNDQERIRELKYHINQLLSELRLIEPNHNSLEEFPPFNITLNSSLTTRSNEKYGLVDHQCPYLTRQQTILHSTTYQEYKKLQQRKKHYILTPKKNFVAFACATSTPKNSPNQNILLKQPHLTSTPRRNKRQSTNIIPLKRLLYHKDVNRQRHSAKRSILPRYSSLHPIDENPQWI
jgi:hypothetical protein